MINDFPELYDPVIETTVW